MIYDPQLQQKFISALLKRPKDWLSVHSFFSDADMFDEDKPRDSMIVSLIRQAVEKGEDVDGNIISQRVNQLNLAFEGNLSPADYVLSLSKRNAPQEGDVLRLARELKKLSVRRELAKTGEELVKAMNDMDRSASYTEIIERSDSIYNKQVNHFELDDNGPVNIYDDMEFLVEQAGLEVKKEILGKFATANRIYGSLHEPGNITVIIARSAAGKTTLALDECCYVGDEYDIPVLHFDNGEMSKDELQFRRISAMSGVSHHLIKKGNWRNNPETCQKVRAALEKIKAGKSKFYYYCVAGMAVDEMVSIARNFYYKTVGRGKEMIISFDYIKPPDQNSNSSPEWQVLGELVNKFKRFIQKEILFEEKPMISLFTSAQANRSGVVTNKTADKIVDDESIISGADRIIHYSSHAFILRKKTMDEIASDGKQFGTHKFICVKARHLGEDIAGELEPVKDGDTLRKNYINLEFANFAITDKGDLRDIVRSRGTNTNLQKAKEPPTEDDQPF
jgi:replicative DNA helicase